MKNWFKQVLISIDQLINAVFGGYADETMSSVSYRLHRDGVRSWQMKLIDTLFWFDKRTDSTGKIIRHCEDSYLSEKYGRQLPPELRTKEE